MARQQWWKGFVAGVLALGLAATGVFVSGPSALSAAHAALGGAVLFQDRAGEASIPDVAERVSPAVVSVYTSRPANVFRNLEPNQNPFGPGFHLPFGQGQRPPTEQSLGSGVIVSPDGVVLTNNHVVDGAKDIRVVLNDRREFVARVVGRDDKTDVAVLRIDAKNLTTLPLGDSSKMRIGETVLAVGNPLGVGQTVSKGIISAKGRANVGITEYEDFLQTDAAINPGNSGGALVNLRGELVGINTAIASRTGGFQGIGFAIPSNLARQVMDLLMKGGKVNRGQMGVLVQDLTPQLAAAFPDAPRDCVLVGDVLKDSPAEKAGIKRGDIITKLDGDPVRAASELRNRVSLRGAGHEVRLTLWRNRETQEVTVKLREPEAKAAEQTPDEEDSEGKADRGTSSGIAGVRVAAVSAALLRHAELPEGTRGVFVVGIEPSASFIGLKEGDLIVEANHRTVENLQDLRRAIREGSENALLLVRRGPGTVYLVAARDPAGARANPRAPERY